MRIPYYNRPGYKNNVSGASILSPTFVTPDYSPDLLNGMDHYGYKNSK